MTARGATPEGTVRYTSHFNAGTFYRDAGGLRVSSLGLGTYLGGLDERADNGYTAAVATAVSTRTVRYTDGLFGTVIEIDGRAGKALESSH